MPLCDLCWPSLGTRLLLSTHIGSFLMIWASTDVGGLVRRLKFNAMTSLCEQQQASTTRQRSMPCQDLTRPCQNLTSPRQDLVLGSMITSPSDMIISGLEMVMSDPDLHMSDADVITLDLDIQSGVSSHGTGSILCLGTGSHLRPPPTTRSGQVHESSSSCIERRCH